MLKRECAFLGRVRQEFSVETPIVYVLHLGHRAGTSASEAVQTAVRAIAPSLETAANAGVILAIENVADRLHDQSHAGARLTEIADALTALGGGEGTAPVGWTFDLAHALLAYGGDAAEVRHLAQHLLPSLVHIHVNAPRLHLKENEWADRHEAPTADNETLWDLFRLACSAPRFPQTKTITYEVNWSPAGLRRMFGGSSLRDVIQGYALVRDAAQDVLPRLDGGTTVHTLHNSGT